MHPILSGLDLILRFVQSLTDLTRSPLRFHSEGLTLFGVRSRNGFSYALLDLVDRFVDVT
jgi:hypothetical protein